MNILTKAPMLALAVAILSGCAISLPKIDSSPAVLAKVNSIAVIRPPEPAIYALVNFGHPGMAFGLIGGAVAGSDMSNKQDKLNAALIEENLPLVSATLVASIAGQLSKLGFQASVEEGLWEENDGKFKIEYEKIHSDADAVLVVIPVIVGFFATGTTSDYLPTITASVTLLGKDRKELLYRGFHACGWHPSGNGWRYSSVPISFENFDALMAHPKKTADSLTKAASAIASTIAEDLKRDGSPIPPYDAKAHITHITN